LKPLYRLLIPLSVAALVAAGCTAQSGGRSSKSDASSSTTTTSGGGDEAGVDGGDTTTDGGATDGGATDGGATVGGATVGGGTDGGGTDGAGTTTGPVAQICDPGAVGCEGADVVACKSDGSAWNVIETCAGGTTCDMTSASCIADVVQPPVGDCPAAGTGIEIGQKVKDLTWTTTDDTVLNLHSFCGTSSAILIFETAGW
jgi:hypothetical protein